MNSHLHDEIRALLAIERLCTYRQRDWLNAILEHGNCEAASKALGKGHSAASDALNDIRRKAAKHFGHAPGHWEGGVAPGYRMGKVTVQRGPGGVERTWERQHPEAEVLADIMAAIDDRVARIDPLPPVKLPSRFGPDNLLNQISIYDGHIGAHAWNAETGGGNWDLSIAREALLTGASWLMHNLPLSRNGLIVIGGDFTETDGYAAVTPTHHHLLDADGRYPKIFDVAEHVVEGMITEALRIYEHVTVVLIAGNHDPLTIFALRRVFLRVFAENPRVTVDPSIRPYWAMLHGKSMICANHGDKVKLGDLPGIFAADFAPMWGQATYRVCHTGHWHHKKAFQQVGIEMPGMEIIQHPTMAARNAWAAGKGLIAARQLVGHSYHSGGGMVTQLHHRPELLEAA